MLTPATETARVTAHLFTHGASGKRVFLLDTPGFNDTRRDDAEVLRDITFVLAQLHRRAVPVAGLVYCHDITRNRFEGSHVRMLRVFREAIGPAAYGHVVLLSTKWQTLGSWGGEAWNKAVAHEAELIGTDAYWGDLARGGAVPMKWDGSAATALEVVDHVEALQSRAGRPTLRVQTEMVQERKELQNTNAGQIIFEALVGEERKFSAKLAELHAEFEAALKHKNEQHAAELQSQRAEMEAKIRDMSDGQHKLLVDMGQLSRQKIEEYADKLEQLQNEIARLERRMQEYSGNTQQQVYPVSGGRPSGSFRRVGPEPGPLKQQHSRLVKAQLALSLLGVLTGIGVSVAGGMTGNMSLLATGLNIVGGSLSVK